MKYEFLPMPDQAAVADDAVVRDQIVQLVAGLDARFVRVGTILSSAIETIDALIRGLDGMTAALDERTAGKAVADLRTTAGRLMALPAAKAREAERLDGVDRIAATVRAHVLEMASILRVLAIYGMNIKIAASGEPQFVTFVQGMTSRLTAGNLQLGHFLSKLKELARGASGVRQADHLLVGECRQVVPRVPDELMTSAAELETHLGRVAILARKTATIARSVQSKVAVVLGALQVGDRARQRLEHCASTLQILAICGDSGDVPASGTARVRALVAAQLDETGEEFVRETRALLASLADLGRDAQALRLLISDQNDGGGRVMLRQLDQGIAAMQVVTTRLHEADLRSQQMGRVIAATVAELTERLDSIAQIRIDVQDIATNTRLLCRRHGTIGNAVTVIATEVDLYARKLDGAGNDVTRSLGQLGEAKEGLHDEDDGETDAGKTLENALAIIREAFQRTETVIGMGNGDSIQLVELINNTSDELRQELGVESIIVGAAQALAPVADAPIDDPEADAWLAMVMGQIAGLYTMREERDIHARFAPAGAQPPASAPSVEEDLVDDDGLF